MPLAATTRGLPITQSIESSMWTPMSQSGPPSESFFMWKRPQVGTPRRRMQIVSA